MSLHFILSLLILVAEKSLASTTPCNKLPTSFITLQQLTSNNPFTTYWSTWPAFRCAEVVYSLPQSGQTGYDLTGFVSAKPNSMLFRLILRDNTLWDAVLCNSGQRLNYTTPYSNFNGTSKAFCVINCGPDGISYGNMMCLGKTSSDKDELAAFLKQNEIPNVINTQEGCNEVCLNRSPFL